MKGLWICEKCGREFDDIDKCREHEINCNPLNVFQCSKCGKEIKWQDSDPEALSISNKCHYINIEQPGYGSRLDGCNITSFGLCDKCLYDGINTFELKHELLYPRSNNCWSWKL